MKLEFPERLSTEPSATLLPETSGNRFQPLTFAKYFERHALWNAIEPWTPSYLSTAVKVLLIVPEKIALAVQGFGNAGISLGNYLFSKRTVARPSELDAAFILAVQERRSEKVQELIQAGANVNTSIPYTRTSGDSDWKVESTALMYAVRCNCPNMVKVLLKADKNLNEALDVAIKEGHLDVVEELIKGGADINYVNENKDTPLIIAIKHARATAEFSRQAQEKAVSRWCQRREIIQTLLKAGANVNHVNKYGRTALMEAVIEHDLKTVQNLLQVPEIKTGSFFGLATKPINYADLDGNTALILAIQRVRYSSTDNQGYNICMNSQHILNALLKTPGIDPHHVNKNGETAITLLEKLNNKMKGYPY